MRGMVVFGGPPNPRSRNLFRRAVPNNARASAQGAQIRSNPEHGGHITWHLAGHLTGHLLGHILWQPETLMTRAELEMEFAGRALGWVEKELELTDPEIGQALGVEPVAKDL